jgi:hypothetical protein
MKRRTIKAARELGVKLYAKLSDGTRLPWTSKKTKLWQTLARCTEKQWSEGVVVSVVYQPDVENSNKFYKLSKVKESVNIWLEPDLVEFATEKGGF